DLLRDPEDLSRHLRAHRPRQARAEAAPRLRFGVLFRLGQRPLALQPFQETRISPNSLSNSARIWPPYRFQPPIVSTRRCAASDIAWSRSRSRYSKVSAWTMDSGSRTGT